MVQPSEQTINAFARKAVNRLVPPPQAFTGFAAEVESWFDDLEKSYQAQAAACEKKRAAEDAYARAIDDMANQLSFYLLESIPRLDHESMFKVVQTKRMLLTRAISFQDYWARLNKMFAVQMACLPASVLASVKPLLV